MAINPTKMRPTDVVRLLNSTELGSVIGQARIYRDFNRVGFRIAANNDPRSINLLKYCAWLLDCRNEPEVHHTRTYEEKKEAERARNAAKSLAGRDIGNLPPVEDPERKANCAGDFRRFCETYFSETFSLGWSGDHLKVISKIETAVLKGGLFALAMPRGSGKSSLTEAAALWALLYGHREFVVLIGATETAATEMIDSIKTELEVNEWLNQDFPEVCFPIRALDGIANRCAGQLYQGERTRISWTANEIILPTIAGSPASGAIVRVAGITGRVRGMKYKKPNGKSIRPSLVIIDDPQTSESASSIEQTHKRVRVLAGDILGLAGPGQKISGIMPCTIIRPGDMAEQILDRTKHPEWNGERTQMVVTFPTNTRLWEQYAEIRAENLRRDGTFAEATEFYRTHQAEMDRGAVVSWPERFNYDEISAIQHAMNLRLQDEGAFYAEYQNEPLPEDIGSGEQLSVDLVTHKLNGHPRWEIPLGCTRLTMFIDVQKTLLYYAVCAWEGDFTGVVVDYGSFPDQQRPYFTLADATHTLQHTFTRSGLEGCLYQGLQALTESLLGKEWVREDGATMKVEQCLIDANWGASTDVVYQFCRESPYAHILMPSHGRYIGASSQPLNERRRQPGERVGQNWLVPSVNRKRAIRHLVYDTNFWKSFVAARWLVTLGDRGCLSLWGRDPVRHLCYAEHLCAEYRVPTEGRGRKVDEWKLRPESHDNHWLDCTVGCAVAASMLGETLPCANLSREKKPKRVLKLSSVQKRKEMGL